MISTSAYFAASRNGVAPASDAGRIHQLVARGTRLPPVSRTSGSAPWAISVLTSVASARSTAVCRAA